MHVLFDVTGVLTSTKVNPWEVVNTKLGVSPERDSALFEQFISGELDYKGWIESVVAGWGEKRRHEIESAGRSVPTLGRIGGAVLREITRSGHKVGILSTLPNTVQRGVLGTLEGPHVTVNTPNQLTFRRPSPDAVQIADMLTGVKVAVNDEASARLEVARTMGTPLNQMVYVGAGSGCIAVMQEVGLSFAPVDSPAAEEVATATFHHLAQVPELLKQHAA